MKTFIIFVILMLGSFALRAQDDVGKAQSDVSDEQVIAEMKTYLTHISKENTSAQTQAQQLEILQKVKYFWKIPEFRKLRAMSIDKIFLEEEQNPYFLSAIAFHDENIERWVEKFHECPSENDPNEEHLKLIKRIQKNREFIDKAVAFIHTLQGGDNSFVDAGSYTAQDIGFDYQNPTHLLTLQELVAALDSDRTTYFEVIDLAGRNTFTGHVLNNLSGINSDDTFLTPHYYITKKLPYEHPNYSDRHYNIFDIKKDKIVADVGPVADKSIHLTPDQTTLGYVSPDKPSYLQQYTLETGSTRNRWIAPDLHIRSFRFGLDNQHILFGLDGGQLFIAQSLTNSCCMTARTKDDAKIFSVVLNPQNTLAAFRYFRGNAKEEGAWYTYDIYFEHLTGPIRENLAPISVVLDPVTDIQDFFFSPTGELVIVTTYVIQFWDVINHKELYSLHSPSFRYSNIDGDLSDGHHIFKKVITNASGSYLAALLENDTVSVYKRGNAELDLESILLVDPDRVDPKLGGGK